VEGLVVSEPIIGRAGFLAGNYPEHDPATGLAEVLDLVEFGEQAGYQVAGVRQRHVERGISSALPFLAAASQRTLRIRLETDVVPLGYETPFRLAEDFATVDALSRGRVNVGVSTSAPHADLLADLARPDAASTTDPYELIERFLTALEGNVLGEDVATPYGTQSPRVQPHVEGLRSRVWLGGGSERSVRWTARRGLKLLLGNLADGDGHDSFESAQRAHIDLYYQEFAGSGAAVGVERVILPLDSTTDEQRAHYTGYAAARDERTQAAVGPRGTRFGRDLIGTGEQIAERLAADPAFDGLTELRVALPYAFTSDEYRQVLGDIVEHVLPHLGWVAASARETVAA
jgi:alkanesulfonate monooxygenase SsuD/methylene tetrahydromethanopterin reductase-like flavin-dependent oxidoreductase (luciferase family)